MMHQLLPEEHMNMGTTCKTDSNHALYQTQDPGALRQQCQPLHHYITQLAYWNKKYSDSFDFAVSCHTISINAICLEKSKRANESLFELVVDRESLLAICLLDWQLQNRVSALLYCSDSCLFLDVLILQLSVSLSIVTDSTFLPNTGQTNTIYKGEVYSERW